jgi:dolichol-phosphate mannosyltransferase
VSERPAAPEGQREDGAAGAVEAFVRRVAAWRFLKFGVVGASGVPVNLAVLWLGQNWLFAQVTPDVLRLNLSLALAIFCATVNNFAWNRKWTWRDRKKHVRTHRVLQFGQYAIASWVGIVLQFVFTNLLVARFHYLLANAIAIVIASVFNYLANDLWTFGRIRLWLQRRT